MKSMSGTGTRACRVVVWGGAGLLLLLPWLAMQVGTGVNWDVVDFIVFGAMLGLAAGACEIVLRASGHWVYRLAAAIAIGTAFLTVWTNLAVGMIGSQDNAANLLFGAVLLVAAAGALLVRMRAAGMVVVMATAAAAQMIASVVAVLWSGWDAAVVLALGFALPWLASSLLFLAASRPSRGGALPRSGS